MSKTLTTAEALCDSLLHHADEWDDTEYTVKHNPSGIILWTSNGWSFLKSYFGTAPKYCSTIKVLLTRREKKRVWAAYIGGRYALTSKLLKGKADE